MGPLCDLTVALAEQGPAYRAAAATLTGLGAAVGTGGDGDVRLGGRGAPGATLVPSPVRCPQAGLPAGTLRHATGLALASAALTGWRTGTSWEVHELGVAMELWLPEVMAAAYSAPPALRPGEPVPAPGGGWLQLDLGAPGDRDDYDRLLSTIPPASPAAVVAAAAQEWRLAVCDYRPRTPGGSSTPARWRLSAGRPPAPPAGLAVCDLTAMWAGPLATRLLQDLGATIHKVEPAFRPDGMRATSGGGIHPGGLQKDPGRDSGMWNALNAGKTHADLDLRRPDQRAAFAELAGRCDVVIDSFSPRVMANFALDGAIEGDPLMVSMPAFGPGARRDWVAYGTGVHAICGLGDAGDGSFRAPAVAYPDPLAGFTGALAVLAGAAGRDLGVPVGRMEAAVHDSVQPIASLPFAGPVGRVEPETGARLLDAAREAGLLHMRLVAGLELAHPAGPFRALAGYRT